MARTGERHSKRGSLAQFWREAGRPLRTITLVMWSVGAFLTFGGMLGDQFDWWSERPFLTNLGSGLVGGLIGVPIVLLIFQRVSVRQNDRASELRAVRLMDGAIRHLERSAGVILDTGLGNGVWTTVQMRLGELKHEPGPVDVDLKEMRDIDGMLHSWWRENFPVMHAALSEMHSCAVVYREAATQRILMSERGHLDSATPYLLWVVELDTGLSRINSSKGFYDWSNRIRPPKLDAQMKFPRLAGQEWFDVSLPGEQCCGRVRTVSG